MSEDPKDDLIHELEEYVQVLENEKFNLIETLFKRAGIQAEPRMHFDRRGKIEDIKRNIAEAKLPPYHRKGENFWKLQYREAHLELQKVNLGVQRLRRKLDRLKGSTK